MQLKRSLSPRISIALTRVEQSLLAPDFHHGVKCTQQRRKSGATRSPEGGSRNQRCEPILARNLLVRILFRSWWRANWTVVFYPVHAMEAVG